MATRSRPRPQIPLDDTLDFMRLLWAIEHGLQRSSKRMEATLGVTGPQRLVLRIVREHPGLTARHLADMLHLHASTITGILQRLEVKGLLIRERDPLDNRRIRLKVATQTRKLTDRSGGTIEAVIEVVLSRLPAAHVAHARDVLAALALALEGDIAES